MVFLFGNKDLLKKQELIDNTVADLELNFADEVRKSDSAAAPATADKGPDIIIPSGAGGKGPEIIKPN